MRRRIWFYLVTFRVRVVEHCGHVVLPPEVIKHSVVIRGQLSVAVNSHTEVSESGNTSHQRSYFAWKGGKKNTYTCTST